MIQEYLEQIDAVIRSGKYKADWESLANHKTPAWYTEGKLGIFIHWGIYSVPAHSNEWYSRHMYLPGHEEYEYHRKTYGEQKDFGYKDFIPSFTGEKFSADAWVSLFKKAGARFVMPVAEHHDGFAMYDTAFNRWNAKNMGPCRNVVGEIKAACEREGLQFCASTHRAEHYFFMNSGRGYESDVNDPAYADFYGPAVSHPELDGDTIKPRLHLMRSAAGVFLRPESGDEPVPNGTYRSQKEPSLLTLEVTASAGLRGRLTSVPSQAKSLNPLNECFIFAELLNSSNSARNA